MKTHELVFYCATVAVALFGGGFMVGQYTRNTAEVDALRARVRQVELQSGQYGARLDTLEGIGIEVRVVDVSAHLDALWVLELREHEKGKSDVVDR